MCQFIICEKPLWDLVVAAKHDSKAMEEIIGKFEPKLSKYARLLGYDDAKQELIYLLLEMLHSIKPEKISHNEGAVVNYIAKSIYTSYIKLSQKNRATHNTVEYEEYMVACKDEAEQFDSDFWLGVQSSLSELEFTVIVLHYVYGFNDAEISRKRGVSRQAASSTRKRAENKLKKLFDDKG